MLIAFGVAILGVVIEAFAGASIRARIQPFVAIGGLIASLVAVIIIGLDLNDPGAGHRRIIAATAVAMDGPALFLEGLLAAPRHRRDPARRRALRRLDRRGTRGRRRHRPRRARCRCGACQPAGDHRGPIR